LTKEGILIWDINKGTLIQIDEQKKITKAFRGWEILQNEEIKTLYGSDPTFDEMLWPKTDTIFTGDHAHRILLS
jgi:hypothetical protein